MPSTPGGRGALTETELLDTRPVQSIAESAVILRLFRRNGDPNRRAVHQLIRDGKLRQLDPTQPIHRWTVSSDELRRYITDGPRTGAA